MMNDNITISRTHLDLDDRQAAERKLCRLFSSFGIDPMDARERLIDPFVMRAAQFWRGHHGIEFAALAVEEAEIDLKAWFAKILGIETEDDRTSLMKGRAAFLMCGGAKCFPGIFLKPVDHLPDDFILAMRNHILDAVPPDVDGDMHHQPYEAWSLRQMMTKVLTIDKVMIPSLGDFMKKDGRGFAFNWRNTGPTS